MGKYKLYLICEIIDHLYNMDKFVINMKDIIKDIEELKISYKNNIRKESQKQLYGIENLYDDTNDDTSDHSHYILKIISDYKYVIIKLQIESAVIEKESDNIEELLELYKNTTDTNSDSDSDSDSDYDVAKYDHKKYTKILINMEDVDIEEILEDPLHSVLC